MSNHRLLIIDKASMLSNLNLAYVHLCLEEIFAHDKWFGGVNVLFVGDILQLPPVNGAPVFDRTPTTVRDEAGTKGEKTAVNAKLPRVGMGRGGRRREGGGGEKNIYNICTSMCSQCERSVPSKYGTEGQGME